MNKLDAARHFPHEAALALQKENLPSKELPERLEEWLEEHLSSNRKKISSQGTAWPLEGKRPSAEDTEREGRSGGNADPPSTTPGNRKSRRRGREGNSD